MKPIEFEDVMETVYLCFAVYSAVVVGFSVAFVQHAQLFGL